LFWTAALGRFSEPGWPEIKWYISGLVYTDDGNILAGSVHKKDKIYVYLLVVANKEMV
jgi:hypothetical protein